MGTGTQEGAMRMVAGAVCTATTCIGSSYLWFTNAHEQYAAASQMCRLAMLGWPTSKS